jgi:hypothetical protein
MKKKLDIKALVSKIKATKTKIEEREHRPIRIDIDYTKPMVRERNMMNDAIDQGATGTEVVREARNGTV